MVLLITVLWITAVVSAAYFLLTIMLPDLFTDNSDSVETEPLLTDSPVPSPLCQGEA
jgi:hypothetical protein